MSIINAPQLHSQGGAVVMRVKPDYQMKIRINP